jgi:malonate-semialdehyde dehydrogenase (acetylating)/methylmalonate-semialdehyde dehydrogenase
LYFCWAASEDEVRAAVENAMAAQPGWAAANPQRRARVMMKFVSLLQRDMDKLAEALSARARQDHARRQGRRAARPRSREFCIGAPHLLKGEYTEGAGPGIDMYSMRQPLGVVAGITPFNFPAMIPMWKFRRRSPAATPSSSSRPSATPPCR